MSNPDVAPHSEGERSPREKRQIVLSALMGALPARVEPLYGRDAAHYRELFEEHALEELQAMFASRMATVTRKWDEVLGRHIKPHGLGLRHWRALYMLAVLSEGETLTSIATRMGVPNPTLVRILHDLEADGLIERTVDAQDRRAKTLALTEAGSRIFSRVSVVNGQLRGRYLDGISEPELLLIIEILDLLNRRLDQNM